jgi:3-hydroxybutyryl-CoA dehydrogenase
MNSSIKTIGVVGAGTMGQGIAQVFASGDLEVLLFDANPTLPPIAISKIDRGLKSLVAKGKMNDSKRESIIKKIHPIEILESVKADLIIEAVIEDLKVKQNIFQELEKINTAQTVFCTNTSSLSITKIFSTCKNQARCLGVHFFNPAQIMKLVELVAGDKTNSDIVTEVGTLLKDLGKTTVISKDSPGFIVNRVARHFYLESLKILEEGVASVKDIDTLLKSSGFKMGPFEIIDLIGIYINMAVSTAVYHGFNQNSKYKPNEIQIEKVKQGQLGRKNGNGFYEYPKNN